MQKQKLSPKRTTLITITTLILAMYAMQLSLYFSGRLFNVSVGNLHRSFASPEDVSQMAAATLIPKKLSAKDSAYVILPEELDLAVDTESLSAPFENRWQLLVPLWGFYRAINSHVVEPKVTANSEKIVFVAERIATLGQRDPIDARVVLEGNAVTVIPETNGIKLEKENVLEALKSVSTSNVQVAELRAELVKPNITVDKLQPAVDKLTSLTAKTLTVKFSDSTYTLTPEKVAQLLGVAGSEVIINKGALNSLIADWSLALSKPAGVTQEEYYDDELVSTRRGESGQTIDNDKVYASIESWIRDPQADTLEFDILKVSPRINRTFRYSRSSQQLQAKLDAWVAKNPGRYMIAVQELNGQGRQAMINGERTTVMASTYKMFLAYASYTLSENGQLDLSSAVYNGKTIEQCIEEGIVYSDNPCPISIGRKIGWQNATDIINDAGFTSVFLNNYHPDGSFNGDKRVHANDQARFLMQLSAGQLLNSTNTEKLLGYMKRQVYRDGIPAGSGGSVVADKVGFLDGYYYHDVGIVYGPKSTYALVVLTEESGWSYIRDVAGAVYQFMQE